jgi:hypothetical protein
MLPMLLKPKAAASVPVFATQGYSRLWATTAKNGAVSGTVASDTGSYAVKWWDGSTETLSSGSTFSKSGSGIRAFEVYPASVFTPNAVNGSNLELKGASKISTEAAMFGGASAKFQSYGDYLTGDVTFDWSANWTLELWVRRFGGGIGEGFIFQAGGIQGGRGGVHIGTIGEGTVFFNNAITESIQGGVVPENQWVHIAAVRTSGTNSLYVNGTRVGTSTQTFPVEITNFTIGGVPSYGFYSNSYIDEFRLVQSAIYSGSSITVPTSSLSAITGTALLLHFDSASSAPSGGFDGFSVASNEITKLRAESVSLATTAG